MSWLETSRALRASSLSSEGLARLGKALETEVEVVRTLHGGVASSVHQLRTPLRDLVLKRFSEKDSAVLEWERLQAVLAVPVPTPVPVALDADGDWFGVPAFVVTYLEGEAMYPPRPEALGRLLATIHSTPVAEPIPAVLLRPGLWQTWTEPDPPVAFPDGLVPILDRLRDVAVEEDSVLIHCDFHPGNVIVRGDDVAGVVDWSGPRLGPRGFDVALTRCDLAIEPGGGAPEAFLTAYESAAGARVEHLALWDVLAGARALEQGHGWIDAWTDMGIPLTKELLWERALAFTTAAIELARSSGR